MHYFILACDEHSRESKIVNQYFSLIREKYLRGKPHRIQPEPYQKFNLTVSDSALSRTKKISAMVHDFRWLQEKSHQNS